MPNRNDREFMIIRHCTMSAYTVTQPMVLYVIFSKTHTQSSEKNSFYKNHSMYSEQLVFLTEYCFK